MYNNQSFNHSALEEQYKCIKKTWIFAKSAKHWFNLMAQADRTPGISSRILCMLSMSGLGQKTNNTSHIWNQKKKQQNSSCSRDHLNDEEAVKGQRDCVAQEYHSSSSSRKRRVRILIRKSIDCQVHKHISQKEGRWDLLGVSLEAQRRTTANNTHGKIRI